MGEELPRVDCDSRAPRVLQFVNFIQTSTGVTKGLTSAVL